MNEDVWGSTPSDSLSDVRRAAEQFSAAEIKHFSCNVSVSKLSPSPRTPVGQQGLWKCCEISDRVIAYKNLIGVSVSFLISYAAFVSEVSLQSSINAAEGLGLASLVSLYASFMLAGIITPIMKVLGTKYSLVVGYLMFLLYTVANYYPHWYTLIPASVLLGIAFGPIWASLNTHITSIAYQFAPSLQEEPTYLVSIFNGVHVFFYKLSYVPGNLASSIILFSGQDHNGSSMAAQPLVSVNQSVCNNTEAANVDRLYLYILVSVFVVFDIVAILLVLLIIDNLKTERKFMSRSERFKEYVKKPVASTLKIFFSLTMILQVPMAVLDGLMLSFVLGPFPKLFVSDCIGVQWVGFSLTMFGVGSAISGFVGGRLVKCIPQYVVIYFISTLNAGLLLFLVFWPKRPTYYVPFLTLFGFGACEGTWNSMGASIVGILFAEKKEEAFSANRFWFAFGFMIGFLMALVLSIEIHLYIMLATVVINFVAYTCLILKTQTKQELLPCCYYVSEQEGNAENLSSSMVTRYDRDMKSGLVSQESNGKKEKEEKEL